MNKLLLAACSTSVLLSGCATTGVRNDTVTRTAVGTAAGAAIGALGGGFEGAVIGAVAGGAIGALVPGKILKGRQYYRDTRGYCYYVDREGRPQYDGTVRC